MGESVNSKLRNELVQAVQTVQAVPIEGTDLLAEN
jgi:hypothetical protein